MCGAVVDPQVRLPPPKPGKAPKRARLLCLRKTAREHAETVADWQDADAKFQQWLEEKARCAVMYQNASTPFAPADGRRRRLANLCCRWALGLSVTVPLVMGASVALFLPAFFLLLLVRTTTVETDDTKFVQRQDKIESETKAKHGLRMCRFLGRVVPMFAFCTAWPVVLVLLLLPRLSRTGGVCVLLVHFAAVLALQALGTIRAGQSWVERRRVDLAKEKTLPKRPTEPGTSLPVLNPGNVVAMGSLLLEFIQLATFSLNHDAAAADDDGGATDVPAWIPGLAQVVYFKFLAHSEVVLVWGSVGLVAVLLAVFAAQFLVELRVYGLYLKANTSSARDYFFSSLTGAVVFGHGQAKHIGSKTKAVVAAISDTLYLSVAYHLVQPFICVPKAADDDDAPLVMAADDSVECYNGQHKALAACALVALTFYVCLSVMLAPMLMADAPKDSITFVKAYLMFGVLVKTAMIVASGAAATVFASSSGGGAVAISAAASALASSVLLLVFTVVWLARVAKSNDVGWLPCEVTFVNRFKVAGFGAGVATAALALVARFHVVPLGELLPVVWLLFGLLPVLWHSHSQHELKKQEWSERDLLDQDTLAQDGVELPAKPEPAFQVLSSGDWATSLALHTQLRSWDPSDGRSVDAVEVDLTALVDLPQPHDSPPDSPTQSPQASGLLISPVLLASSSSEISPLYLTPESSAGDAGRPPTPPVAQQPESVAPDLRRMSMEDLNMHLAREGVEAVGMSRFDRVRRLSEIKAQSRRSNHAA